MGFIPEHSSPQRKFTELSLDFSWKTFKDTIGLIKNMSPKAVVVFYAPWWISLAVWLAGVSVRVGRLSQWHSFLFFNYGIRQSRSEAVYHEYIYNLRLLKRGFLRAKLTKGLHDASKMEDGNSLKLTCNNQEIVKKHNLTAKQYIVVHPGMRSSALNWPCSHYIQFIKKLLTHHKVAITGTAGDRQYLAPLQLALDEHKNLIWLNEKLDTSELICILEQAKGVVAPSTGVVHLAASTGTPTLGLYSPIKVEGSTRWSPRGACTAHVTPEFDPDNSSKDIMAHLSVDRVYLTFLELVEANEH